MKIPKIYPVIIFFLILAGIILFNADRYDTLGKKDSVFAYKDTFKIDRIEITDNRGNEVSFNRGAKGWMVNQEYQVRKTAFRGLMKALYVMEVDAPLPSSVNDTLNIHEKGGSLKIYKGNRLKQHLFFTNDNLGRLIVKKHNASKAFYIRLPGITIDEDKLFTARVGHWRDNVLFHFDLQEITSVTFQDFMVPGNSFHIQHRNDSLTFSPLSGTLHVAALDTNRVWRYLSYFQWVLFEKMIGENRENLRDSLMHSIPMYKIQVKSANKEEEQVSLFRIPTGRNDSIPYDLNRCYGLKNNRETVVITYLQIDPLLKERDYFSRE